MERQRPLIRWLFGPRDGPTDGLVPRWLFLRALAAIYFSAFFSLLYQIKGLIGPHGILPAQQYLAEAASLGASRFWFAPSLFWLSAGSHALMAVMWIGLLASVFALLNLWPRLAFFVCFVCFLSFVSVAGEFSGYQSDGMLLEAGFLALFFAPGGLLPGWGAAHPPPRVSLWLLQWEWFRIYFESGLVKLLSGDLQWRNLTAMDEYYQNGPLPTWIGWYVEHLPHWFHRAAAPRPTDLLPHRHAVGDRRHPHRQLRLPQLPCTVAGVSIARRRRAPALSSCALHVACNPPACRTGLRIRSWRAGAGIRRQGASQRHPQRHHGSPASLGRLCHYGGAHRHGRPRLAAALR
jgi:hypothetical protein